MSRCSPFYGDVMEHYEYVGEVLPEGKLSVIPSISQKLIPGQKIRIRIEQLSDKTNAVTRKEMDAATRRLLDRMQNAQPLETPEDPANLRHSVLFEERMEEKFPWRE